MASHSELSLDCKQHQSHSMLLKSFGEQSNTNDHQSQQLEEFLARLEEERLKIDAFTRELPLCMQLLTNAVETYRQQLQSYRSSTNYQSAKPVLEEFIPLKNGNFEGSSEKVAINMNMPDNNKENWMTSAQLWVQTAPTDHENETNQQQQQSEITTKQSSPEEETNKQRNISNGGGEGGFVLFPKARRALPEPAIASSDDDKEMEDKRMIASVVHAEQGKRESQSTISSNNNNCTPTNTTQTQRKARRCWSPDLHRRFVNALQLLGGSQVATPKQIRELMKVDGLTNDEVKSHLQKYRLHTRRPMSPNPVAAAATAATPQLVVLGGIWVPPEYANGGVPPTLYGAHSSNVPNHHATTTHYCGPPPQMMSQDLYSSPATPQAPSYHHNHSLYHQLHMFRPMTTTHQGHGSEENGGGGRSESIEDGKSESGSWKADSGEDNGGERKSLVLREGEEGSNGIGVRLLSSFN